MRRRRLFTINGAAALAVGVVGAALLVSGGTETAIARPAPLDRAGSSAGLAVTIQPDRYDVYPGDAVTMLVTVANTGNLPLGAGFLASSVEGISVGAITPDGCEHTRIEALAPGRVARYACAVEAPAATFTFGITATASEPGGHVLTDTATVAAGAPKAALSTTIAVAPWPHRTGETVAFRVGVRNEGAVPLTRVSTVDSTFPGCSQADLGTLAPGQERGYTCLGTAPLDDETTAVLARGTAADQPEVRAISSFVPVDVIHPALVVTGARSRRGLAVTVTNVGDTSLEAVHTLAPDAPRCVRSSLGPLGPGESVTYRCAAARGRITATGTASAPADPAAGPPEPVTGPQGADDGWGPDSAAAAGHDVADYVELLPAGRADLTVTQRASRVQAQAGTPVSYAITVRNTGSVTLGRVVLRDPLFANCDGVELGSLAPRRRARLVCTIAAPAADVSHVAIVVGEPTGAGEPTVAAVSRGAALHVIHPALAVTLTADPPDPYPGESVRWVLTVANIGDVPVRRAVARSAFGGCSERLGTLRAEDVPAGFRCSAAIGSSSVTNVVTVSGRLSSGETITEIASATAQVRAGSGPGGRGSPAGAPQLERGAAAPPSPPAAPPQGEAVEPSPIPSETESLPGGPGVSVPSGAGLPADAPDGPRALPRRRR